MKAFKDAYKDFPVAVYEGAPGARADIVERVKNHDRDTGIPGCGQQDGRLGRIGYVKHMEEAQRALNIPITSASQLQAVLSTRSDLISAIGTGIGVASAHEAAHSFLSLCCSMHTNPTTDPGARAAYNASSCDGVIDPSQWLGYWPANYPPPQVNPRIEIHWQPAAKVALGQCLGTGWKEHYGPCHNP